MEFSKIITLILIGFCLACIAADYVLKYIVVFHDVNMEHIGDDVTKTMIVTILGTAGGYMFKSSFEKCSRNKHGLDKDGNPHCLNNGETSDENG